MYAKIILVIFVGQEFNMIRFLIGFLMVFGAVGNDEAPILQVLALASVGLLLMYFGTEKMKEQEYR